jgi:hypothetical protein
MLLCESLNTSSHSWTFRTKGLLNAENDLDYIYLLSNSNNENFQTATQQLHGQKSGTMKAIRHPISRSSAAFGV